MGTLHEAEDGKRESLGVLLAEAAVTLVNCSRQDDASQLARYLLDFYSLHDLEIRFFMLVLSKELSKVTRTLKTLSSISNPFYMFLIFFFVCVFSSFHYQSVHLRSFPASGHSILRGTTPTIVLLTELFWSTCLKKKEEKIVTYHITYIY